MHVLAYVHHLCVFLLFNKIYVCTIHFVFQGVTLMGLIDNKKQSLVKKHVSQGRGVAGGIDVQRKLK